jgi:hypothetical protein
VQKYNVALIIRDACFNLKGIDNAFPPAMFTFTLRYESIAYTISHLLRYQQKSTSKVYDREQHKNTNTHQTFLGETRHSIYHAGKCVSVKKTIVLFMALKYPQDNLGNLDREHMCREHYKYQNVNRRSLRFHT